MLYHIFINMDIKQIIKEELDDFEWVRETQPSDFSNLDTTKDYMNVWPQFKKMFVELDIPYVEGIVESDDYEGSCELLLKNDYFEFEIYANFVYDEGTIETGVVNWSIQNLKKYGYVKGQHSLVTHDWLKPIVDKLREMIINSINKLNESEKILESLFNKLSILTEDGKIEPDMEWDFTKGELDKSKRWVKTKEDVKKYLTLLFDKMKRIPKKVKINILKYVLASFVGILTVSELTKTVEEVSDGKIVLSKPTEKIIKPEVVKIERIRKPSDSLIEFLKGEEGYSDKGYDIGDGKITIGWGHAEDINDSQYKVGQKISKQEAEKLLRQDVQVSSESLNRILNDWEKQNINIDINQDMYDTMVSMIFNMGIGSFRMSNFIQLVKRGEMEKAKEEIKSVSSQMFSKYPGLKKRRKKESEMFNLV